MKWLGYVAATCWVTKRIIFNILRTELNWIFILWSNKGCFYRFCHQLDYLISPSAFTYEQNRNQTVADWGGLCTWGLFFFWVEISLVPGICPGSQTLTQDLKECPGFIFFSWSISFCPQGHTGVLRSVSWSLNLHLWNIYLWFS